MWGVRPWHNTNDKQLKESKKGNKGRYRGYGPWMQRIRLPRVRTEQPSWNPRRGFARNTK